VTGTGPAGNGEAHMIQVTEMVLEYDGRSYRITHESALTAFQNSPVGKTSGPGARYFIRVDDDFKSMASVLEQIIPFKSEALTPEIADRVSELFRALGFEVRDRHRHHE
jgi:hypothetical protein